MPTVKPSKQYAMKVVAHRPIYRFFVIAGWLVVCVNMVVVSFYAGRYYAVGNTDGVVQERDQLREQYASKVQEVLKLDQQVANLTLAGEVDLKANEEVRAEVVQLKTRLAELEQDNTFYRGLMRPAPGDKGLVVDPPAITATKSEGVYQYNLVIKQIVTKHRKVAGYVEFELLGKEGEELRRIALKDISDTINKERIKLNFKYFQRIEGEMALPQGFIPERLELKVVTSKPSEVVIDKKFGWLTQEG